MKRIEIGIRDGKPVADDERTEELPFGSRARVFLYLRQNPNVWRSPADIARATDLKEENVKSALKTVERHPLVREKKGEKDLEKVAYFRLL
ncbi:hypothetical protein MUO83_02955 [Candidatus Bathyarchaeota archaeon]|nr:hypothetical protein [Candidatus Bathyarchaeota archaeon]